MWPMNCMQVRTNKIFEMLHHPTHGARKFSPNRVLCNMWYHLMHHPTNSFESKTKDGSHWNYHVNVTMCQFVKNHSDDWLKKKSSPTTLLRWHTEKLPRRIPFFPHFWYLSISIKMHISSQMLSTTRAAIVEIRNSSKLRRQFPAHFDFWCTTKANEKKTKINRIKCIAS